MRRLPSVGCTTKERSSFFTRETVQRFCKVYFEKADQQAPLRAKQWRHAEEASPRCTVVAGPIDLYTGGEGGMTPMRKLIPLMTGFCPSKKNKE